MLFEDAGWIDSTSLEPRRRRLDHSGTKALSEARPLRSALSRSRRLLDNLRGLPRMRQERDVARRDLARRRADPLRVEPLELRVDCSVLRRNDVPGGNGLPRGGGDGGLE